MRYFRCLKKLIKLTRRIWSSGLTSGIQKDLVEILAGAFDEISAPALCEILSTLNLCCK